MRLIPVKIFFYWLITRLSFTYPKLILQDRKKYQIIHWKGGNFYYVNYCWKGGFFEDALNIIREFIKISIDRGKNEQVLGRFLNDEEWQLGIIANSDFNINKIYGLSIKKDMIPAGTYAMLKGKGFPEHIFTYWFWLKRKLKHDNYEILNPTFELYEKNTFIKDLPNKYRIGQIRYMIKENE